MQTEINPFSSLFSGKRLPSLDGIRALSITAVMFYHSFGMLGARIGVSTFFVLSGFLVTWLLVKEYSDDDSISLKGFYYRRTLRIFPAYFGFLFLIFLVETLQDFDKIKEFIVPSVFYYYNYYYPVTGNGHPALGHLWSLCVEEQFYILWPLLFMVFARKGYGSVLMLLVSIVLASLIWRLYGYYELNLGPRWLYRAFDSRFDNLAIGCFFAIVLSNDGHRASLWRFVSQAKYFPIYFVTLILSRILGIYAEAYSYTFGFTVEAILIGLLMVQCMVFYERKYFKWLNSRLLVFIGTISYPMYLYHEFAAGISDALGGRLASQFGLDIGPYLVAILGFALTIAMAFFSYKFIETPFLRLKSLWQKRVPVTETV